MVKSDDICSRIIASLKSEISHSELKTWFSQITLSKFEPDLAVFEVPNKFIARWLQGNYINQIQRSFENVLNLSPEIRFIQNGSSFEHNTSDEIPKESNADFNNQQGSLNPSLTFSSFIESKNSIFSYSSALETANKSSADYNPLYIYSMLSLGKTHLLNAIGNHINNTNPMQKVGYFSAGRFNSSFLLASRLRNLYDFRYSFKKFDLIIFDDIHLLGGREKSQKELITILDTFYESKKQIIMAGKQPPSKIQGLLPHLRSRLEWGLLSEILVPDLQTKMKIFNKKITDNKLQVPEDVVFFLINTTNDYKVLTQYLVSLEIYSSLQKRPIDMSVARSVIKNRRFYKTDINDIQKITADYFNISVADIFSNKKSRKYSYPRQLAMYLSRELTNLSLKKIGEEFGNKDHSTVLYAVKRIERDKNLKQELIGDIKSLYELLS